MGEYELALCKISQKAKYEKFKKESCNGVFSLDFDNRLNSIVDYLNERENGYYNFNVDLRSARNINKYFFDEHLPLQNVYLKHKKFGLFNGSPFDIIVEMKNNFPQLGKIHYRSYLENILFESISLDSNLGSNIISIYAHELVHSQIDKNKFELLDNYFDNEFLSIFIELVISSHVNSKYNFNTIENRLEMLKNELLFYKNYNDDLEIRCYIESTLKAFHLYNDYIKSSNLIKKEILNSIEDVFKEKINIGRFSYIYEIDYDNSKDVKYLKR